MCNQLGWGASESCTFCDDLGSIHADMYSYFLSHHPTLQDCLSDILTSLCTLYYPLRTWNKKVLLKSPSKFRIKFQDSPRINLASVLNADLRLSMINDFIESLGRSNAANDDLIIASSQLFVCFFSHDSNLVLSWIYLQNFPLLFNFNPFLNIN